MEVPISNTPGNKTGNVSLVVFISFLSHCFDLETQVMNIRLWLPLTRGITSGHVLIILYEAQSAEWHIDCEALSISLIEFC